MPVQQLPIAAMLIVLAAPGAACGRGVLHTGATGATVAPSLPVPIHPAAGGTCDAGVDACSAQGSEQEGTCDPGRVVCPEAGAGYCFDLQASPEHCGTCGHACEPGSPCENGQCRVVHCTSQVSTRSLPVQGFHFGEGTVPIDCDRDGNLDLLTFGPGIFADQSKSVAILRGNGDGTFVPGERYPIDTPHWAGYSIQIADLNRDQIPDLIIMIPLSDVTTRRDEKLSRVVTRLGQGDCTFGPEIGLDAGAGIINIAIGDLDGDELPDLAVSADERISTFHGNGDGSFSSRQDFSVGGSPLQIVVSDWNSDGIPDVVAGDGYLHLLLGTGAGHFAPAIDCALTTTGWGASSPPLVMADFDRDGVLDLAIENVVLLGMHGCNFTRQTTYAEGQYGLPLRADDFNGDGAIDLVFSGGGAIQLAPSDGQGNFGAAVTLGDVSLLGGGVPGSPVAGDFNGDGRLDLFAAVGSYATTLINTCQ